MHSEGNLGRYIRDKFSNLINQQAVGAAKETKGELNTDKAPDQRPPHSRHAKNLRRQTRNSTKQKKAGTGRTKGTGE
ncbi:hypothetical protein [Mycoplana rhizolycopersici]|uniref:Uncharacterized protein n=1 Tax=Mycoplana rhizolycopersici TaxID=2746702 RepID=A0ABX2QJP3_9HYPH|nr:hypothetical protein [Rhizobium rhizolycopersici]NVP56534.1 hypothetical protein [Rhizobium rhizolycopersici]